MKSSTATASLSKDVLANVVFPKQKTRPKTLWFEIKYNFCTDHHVPISLVFYKRDKDKRAREREAAEAKKAEEMKAQAASLMSSTPTKAGKTASVTGERESMLEAYKIDNSSILKMGRPNPRELMTFFASEKVCNAQEIELRALAKYQDISINDVDKIMYVFNYFDEDGSGEIEFDEFTKMLNVLSGGQALSDKKINDLWLSLDTDNGGEVSFEEFLLWYFQQFGATWKHQKHVVIGQKPRLGVRAFFFAPSASEIQRSKRLINEGRREEASGGDGINRLNTQIKRKTP